MTRLPTLTGQFDLVYIDAAEEEYEAYTRYILDHKLLSPNGVILVDDGELFHVHFSPRRLLLMYDLD
jgi:predicted O-methyltransferase YrrM